MSAYKFSLFNGKKLISKNVLVKTRTINIPCVNGLTRNLKNKN